HRRNERRQFLVRHGGSDCDSRRLRGGNLDGPPTDQCAGQGQARPDIRDQDTDLPRHGNAQAAVAEDSLLVVATDVVQATNDKQQFEPMLGKIDALPKELGETETLLADTGYFSAG